MQSCKGCRILAQDRGEFLFVGGEVEGLLVREDDEARFAAGWLLDVADFRVIDGDLRGAAGFAEMGGEAGGEQDIFLAGLDASFCRMTWEPGMSFVWNQVSLKRAVWKVSLSF